MMRGPGEFLGSRQSGVPLLRLADLERDAALVEQARGALRYCWILIRLLHANTCGGGTKDDTSFSPPDGAHE